MALTAAQEKAQQNRNTIFVEDGDVRSIESLPGEQLVRRIGAAKGGGAAEPGGFVHVTVDEFPESRFADDLRHIVQESVSNALRHSGASRVTVDIDAFGDFLVLSITDDGGGFDPDSVVRGLGLGNLEARVHRLDGELSIRSEQGSGTVVEARIPF